MIRRMGKYEVLARVGRGGMGTVFKAYDPVLHREVALKVISNDIDVTEDTRARFFREAQACARLRHPNIVTVYDMGEDDGRLFIVMEFLDGEDLRGIIANRRRMALEDTLAIMIQVCDGLHYAHQKGVIHRDIKPGNVIVLPEGTAKIVDFGIAHVATQSGGLTRTGLVLGTLRYMSPEQARGRADHRSDIYSVGSVFYEVLASRPALSGDDPIHLLEQLRSEEPPSLSEVNPAVPADLSAVVERAMRKDPAERFADLGEMRLELEGIQLRLVREAAEVRRRIEQKLTQARRLQEALVEQVGGGAAVEPLPSVPERARLETLLAVEREVAGRVLSLEHQFRQVETVSHAFREGLAHLDGGRFRDAIAALEGVLSQVPGHQRAALALEAAHRRAEEQRERQRVVQRLDVATAAFERAAYRECLEALAEVADEAARLGLVDHTGGLRRAAEAALAAEEAAEREERQRQRDMAQAALQRLDDARALAQEADAVRHAAALWLGAEDKAAHGKAALDTGDLAAAALVFEEAAALYRSAEDAARQVIRAEQFTRQRTQADRARQRMMQQRTAAEALDAERRADAAWSRAVGKVRDGEVALNHEAFWRATEAFEEATVLFRRAEEAALEAARREEVDRQRAGAEEARAVTSHAREVAQAAESSLRAGSLWQAAQARENAAQDAVSRGASTQATRLFGEATGLYEEAARMAGVARRHEEEQAEHALERARQWRGRAEAASARDLAPEVWAAAEARMAESMRSMSEGTYLGAAQQMQEAEAFYRQASQAVEGLRRQDPVASIPPAAVQPTAKSDPTVAAIPSGGLEADAPAPRAEVQPTRQVESAGDPTPSAGPERERPHLEAAASTAAVEVIRAAPLATDVSVPVAKHAAHDVEGHLGDCASQEALAPPAVRGADQSAGDAPREGVDPQGALDRRKRAEDEARRLEAQAERRAEESRRRAEVEARKRAEDKAWRLEAEKPASVAASRVDDVSADASLPDESESNPTIKAPAAQGRLVAASAAERTLRKPKMSASKLVFETFGRWFKFAPLVAIPALLVVYVLMPRPMNEVPDRQFLIGRWQSHQMEHGRDVLIYWTIKDDGTTSYDYYVDGQKTDVPATTWTYASGFFQEQHEGASSGRCPVRATGPDSFQIEIVEHGIERNYTRVGPRSRS